MEIVINIILLMILLEFLEIYLHRAETLGMMIEKLYFYYHKSIFLLFIVHPTFYFTLLVALYLNIFNFYMIILLVIKFFDIFFKIELIKQYYVYEEMDVELSKMLDLKISGGMVYFGLLIDVPLLFMAIYPS